MSGIKKTSKAWTTRRDQKAVRLAKIDHLLKGKLLGNAHIIEALELLISPGDKVVLEGDNQKQASFLSKALNEVSADKINGLHMIMSSISRPEHLDIFEKGIAEKIDFSYAGAQSLRVSQMIEDETLKMGEIHTYLELYGRLFIDLIPNIALVAADKADAQGNLYTGANTEETPTIIEATAFKDGIVIVQVNELVEELPRVDIPASWIDCIVVADQPYQLEALFTRDPRHITELQILMAMMTIRGIYERHSVQSLNHGIGFNTAAIELLLPTYGEKLGLKGKICTHFALNPHPTIIPAIESGWVDQIHCFGSEVGMEDYVAARSDVFFTGPDGSLRSNRAFCQTAGLYACDMFIGSTLQIDLQGNSSTVTASRIAGFGGAPNMGADARGRRHPSEPWLKAGAEADPDGAALVRRGRKLVVQIGETFGDRNVPLFVEKLDAIELAEKLDLELAPIMIYGDDVTHIVTEEGVANLLLCRTAQEREQAIRGVAGYTDVGRGRDRSMVAQLRERGVIRRPEDIGINPLDADRNMLAARSIKD